MKTMLKRSMAILLILLMVISVLPMSAMAANALDSTYYPLYLALDSQTSSTWKVYYENNSTYTQGNQSTKDKYIPWDFGTIPTTYKSKDAIKVDDLMKQLTKSGSEAIMPSVYYKSTKNNKTELTATAEADKYSWIIVPDYTEGSTGYVDKQTTEHMELTLRVMENGSPLDGTVPVCVQNPFAATDYTLNYSVTKAPKDGSRATTESGTFYSSRVSNSGDLYVQLATVSGNYDLTLTASLASTKYHTIGRPTAFTKVDVNGDETAKNIKNATGCNEVYSASVTVSPISGYYLGVTNSSNNAKITFYQPVNNAAADYSMNYSLTQTSVGGTKATKTGSFSSSSVTSANSLNVTLPAVSGYYTKDSFALSFTKITGSNVDVSAPSPFKSVSDDYAQNLIASTNCREVFVTEVTVKPKTGYTIYDGTKNTDKSIKVKFYQPVSDIVEDYTLSYTIKHYNASTGSLATNKTLSFNSTSIKNPSNLYVTLPTANGNYNSDSFLLTAKYSSTENNLKTPVVSTVQKVKKAELETTVVQAIKKSTNFDELYKYTVTVEAKDGYLVKSADKFENVINDEKVDITFYQPVVLGYTNYLTIGGVTVMKDLDAYKDAVGQVWNAADEASTVIHGTLDLTSTKTFSPVYNIPIVNSTGSYDTAYTILIVDTPNGECNQTELGLGSNTLKYYPELNGATEQIIKFKIVENNTKNYKYFNLQVKFNGDATAVAYVGDKVTYNTQEGRTYTLNLSSLVENFASFSDKQKAQFTFTISDVNADTASLEYGNYFTMYQGNNATTLTTSSTKTYTNAPSKSGETLENDSYLDDYKVIYTANRKTLASDSHGFTIKLTNTTSGKGTNSFDIDIKFTAGEGVKATISYPTATLSAEPGKSSSSVYLKNYIGNFSADLGLTYKITNRTNSYGTFYVGGSAATVNATGSITASAPAVYYTVNANSAADKTDTMTVTVYQNGESIGTITYTGKVGEGDDCYTERAFNADYPGDDAFGVVVLNVNNRSYTFDASDFANGDIDLSDSDYDDYYIEVIEYPIGGELDGLDRYDTIDVADLDELKYTRTSKSDTGIDAFEFKLYTSNDKSAGSYVMWIVPNEAYLEGDTGYTEEEFKAGYAKTTAFGVYAHSAGYTFDMDDFKNSTYILEEDYVDGTVEITKVPVLGRIKDASNELEEGDEIDVEELADLRFFWGDDYSTSLIDCFEFKVYKKGASTGTTMTMWVVANKSLLTNISENWSGTSTTAPFYKVNDVEVSNNIASVTLDADWVTEALDTVKSGSDVTVAITPKTEAKGLSLTVDKSLFTLANAAKVSYITLSEGTSGASVSVSVSDILSAGGSGKDFTVTMNKLTISTGNDIVANSLVASTATAARAVTFKAGTADITFGSVGAAVLTIPYTNSSSYSDDMVVVFNYSAGNTPMVSSNFTGRAASADITKGGQYLVAVNSISFSDVSSNWAWTRGYIPSLAARGTISGMGGQNAGKYMPDGKLTRAEFVKLLVVSLGLEDNSAANPFSDMSDHWAKQVVAAAVKHSIVSSAATFSPDDPITRRDMALYAYRAAKAAGLTLSSSGSTTTFKDENEITGEYLTAIKAMQAAGIINGMGGQYEGYYLPMNNTDRASAAKIIWFLNAELYGWSTSGKY